MSTLPPTQELVGDDAAVLERWRHLLERGAKLAQLGCGRGAFTIGLALRFPASRFFGFDLDDAAIDHARRTASAAGIGDRAWFEVASAGDFPGTGYHLVAQFGARGDDRQLLSSARHVRRTLAPDGCWMVLAASGDHRDQSRLQRLVFEGGFTRVRCAPATPTGFILEARP